MAGSDTRKQQVNNIRDGLALADPDNESYYFQNAADYNAKLDSLDAKIQDGLTDCMQDTIVPFHTAFAYFGDRYGVKITPWGGRHRMRRPRLQILQNLSTL